MNIMAKLTYVPVCDTFATHDLQYQIRTIKFDINLADAAHSQHIHKNDNSQYIDLLHVY